MRNNSKSEHVEKQKKNNKGTLKKQLKIMIIITILISEMTIMRKRGVVIKIIVIIVINNDLKDAQNDKLEKKETLIRRNWGDLYAFKYKHYTENSLKKRSGGKKNKKWDI